MTTTISTARRLGSRARRRPLARTRSSSRLDNRFLAPILITGILLAGQLGFGILESYTRTLLAIASSIVMEMILGRLFDWQMAAPGQRLYHGDQRRHPDPFAGFLAVYLVQPDLDHLEVCHPRGTAGICGTLRTSASARCSSWPPPRWPA